MRALALVVILAIGSAGCGKRGDPLPPLQRIPTAVNPPRVSQQGQEIVIVWETPTSTVDGGTLVLTEAEVIRWVIEPAPEPPPAATSAPPSESSGEAGAVESESVGSEVAPADAAPSQEDPQEETTTEAIPENAESAAPGLNLTTPSPAGVAPEPKVIARIECNEPGERLEYRDTLDAQWEGMRLEYAVRHVNDKGRRSADSSHGSIEPLPPVAAPSGLEAAAANGYVHLTWSSEAEPPAAAPTPEAATDANEVEIDYGFHVYRRGRGAESYPAQALNRQLLETMAFDDRNVAFGREWCYTVRQVAVRRVPEPSELPAEPTPDGNAAPPDGSVPPQPPPPPQPTALIESAGAEEVCLTPIDTFAPSVPEDVVAIGVPGGVLLSWSESEAVDLGGYRVYRAETREGPFQPLTPELIDVPSFTDQGLVPGKPYFYAVSAVDNAEPANESPRSAVVAEEAPE